MAKKRQSKTRSTQPGDYWQRSFRKQAARSVRLHVAMQQAIRLLTEAMAAPPVTR